MTGEVFSLFADGFAEPLLDLRCIDIVIIDPAFVARVVGRIDVDAFYLARVAGQEGFERVQVVSFDDQIATLGIAAAQCRVRAGGKALPCGVLQRRLFQSSRVWAFLAKSNNNGEFEVWLQLVSRLGCCKLSCIHAP